MLSLFALIAMAQPFLDPMGPISLTSQPPLVDQRGVQAPASATRRPSAEGLIRGGDWIWAAELQPKPVTTRFRKQFKLLAVPRRAVLIATAEVSYRLWINGALVSRGPADAGRDYDSGASGPWFDDVRDVSRFLRKGQNAIAVEVIPDVLVQHEGTTGHPGLKVDLNVTDDAGVVSEIFSNSSWKASLAEDLRQHEGPNGFRIDANLEPPGWQLPEFNDSSWGSSKVVESGRVQTLVSELAPPLEAIVLPLGADNPTGGVKPFGTRGGAQFTSNGSYRIKYPRVMSARIAVRVRGHQGASLHIMSCETDGPGFNRQAEILLRDGEQSIEIPFLNSFARIQIEAKGVREPIEIEEVRAIFCSYPVQYRGKFESDNAELNRVWNVCRWVTQICMQTHHLDSPDHQEPICDPGDYLIEALNSYYAFGESSLARQDLRKFARILEQRHYQNFHTSYALLWLQMLVQYYQYTGDKDLVLELAPNVHALLDRFESYVGKNGLVSNAPNYMFMDWVEIEGFNAHHPPAVIGQAYMTALFYQALADDAKVCTLTGNTERAEKDAQLRTSAKAAFERELWDESKGLYRDGKPFQSDVKPNTWMPEDKQIETFSTQGNTLAVLAGLATPERARSVMTRVIERPDMNCQPYFMHFVFGALDKAGLFDTYALKQIAKWKIQPDSESFFEMWDRGDRSHAWNATPLFQMSGRILGVTPLQPGFKVFEIRPQPSGLSHVKGTIPTPYGGIQVEWTRHGDNIKVNFIVPKGTQAVYSGKYFEPGVHQAG